MTRTTGNAAERCPECGRRIDPTNGCTHCLLQLGKTANDSTSFGTATPYDHYRIVTHSDGSPAEIGRGGMGVTYKAFDKNLRCYVALKVIHQRLLADSSMRERFLREARHAAQLRHPNVASVLHLGTSAEQCFYTMELIEGESVEQLVQRAGPLEPVLALRIVSQVASALTAAAKLRLVHRDIKPSNLMLVRTEAGELLVKVIDFGIAVSLDNKMVEEDATRQGTAGTLQFASPEQLRNQPVDVRSDIYSLGVTLWYMLAARPPFTGSKTQIINGQLTSPPPFDQLSAPLCVRRLLERMLEKDPGRRFSTPAELQRAVAECLDLLGAVKTVAAGKNVRRNTLIATGAVAALIISALTYKLLYVSRTPGATAVQSIAVLPFHALDGAAQTALVAEGIHDEVLASLARHPNLKVISYGSVVDPRLVNMSPAQKGETLGVKTLLEGSLQHVGDEYRVNTHLVHAPTGRTFHAQTYQAGHDDLFGLESRIARDITEALGLRSEEQEHETAPTENIGAYELYLQAREVERQPENEMGTNARKASELYERALSLDRNFVLAEIRLTYLYARLHWQEDDWNLRATYLTKAELAVQHIVKLQPQLPEAHAALGYYYYYGHRDYDHALQEFRIAQRRLPNDSEIAEAIGLVERRKGIWEDSIANLKRATQLDPLNARFLSILSDTYDGLRRYTDEKQVIARERALVGDTSDVRLDAAIVKMKETGNTTEERQVLDGIDPKDDSDATGYARWQVNMMERKFDQAATDAQRAQLRKFEAASAIYPRELLCALAYWSKGDRAAALPLFDKARVAMEPVVARGTEGPRLRIALAMAYAGLGRKDDAIHQGTLAVDERPISVDAVGAPPIITSLARVYTMLGEREKALDLLAKISVVPFGSSRSYLKLDPCWDELHNDPRFQQLTQ
jgi:serine/threonine protein kinase/tetratricopeptide (TPR) repeat protein